MSPIASIVIAILKRLVPALIIAYFTQERGEASRENDRQRWWAFKLRADVTPGKADDALATYFKARFNFHDSPEAKATQRLAEKARLLDQREANL